MLDPINLTPKTAVEQRQNQHEVVKRFTMQVPTGAKVWQCNPQTLECAEVKKHYSTLETRRHQTDSGAIVSDVVAHRSDFNDGMIYILAINKKNAERKLKRHINETR